MSIISRVSDAVRRVLGAVPVNVTDPSASALFALSPNEKRQKFDKELTADQLTVRRAAQVQYRADRDAIRLKFVAGDIDAGERSRLATLCWQEFMAWEQVNDYWLEIPKEETRAGLVAERDELNRQIAELDAE